MKTQNILLNSSNIVPNTNNSRLRYTFPNPQAFDDSMIGVHNVQMYYSWFNINDRLYNNHQFQYRWWNSQGNLASFTVTIPNGYYNVNSINLFLQNEMVRNNHFLTDAAGKRLFYIEFVENPTYYAIQVNLSPMFARSVTLPSGWTQPSTWLRPTSQSTPAITILSIGNFKDLIGFNPGSYPATAQSTLFQKRSDYTPQISPISSLLVRCNLARNTNALPDDVIFNLSQGFTSFGGLINEKPNEIYFSSMSNGIFPSIEITLCDQNFNPVEIIDKNILITLIIKHK